MSTVNYQQAALFEHRFWLQILGDHSRFILNALSPTETRRIQMVQNFMQIFDQLLMQARQSLGEVQINTLTQMAKQRAEEIRLFKLDIIRQHLVEEIKIELPPTFINHMVNEVEEYLRVLNYLVSGQVPPTFHPVHHHLLWLPDAAGHAGAIESSLDAVEKRLIENSEMFAKHFEEYFIKATELKGYLRTGLNQFPALFRFNQQVEEEIKLFQVFLLELQQMGMSNQVLSTLLPLLTDHMFREECYYLTKLAQVSEVDRPNCDPTKPRIEA